jgi:16S rRNA processing protein RimM
MEPAPPKSRSLGGGDEEVELGSITGVFGFKGEVRLYLHNPESDLLRTPRAVVLVAPDGRRRPATLSARPGAPPRVIGRIDGVTDEAEATALRDWRVMIAKATLPALEPDEFYVWQLEGAVVRIDGARVGEVRGVQQAGPTDILEIAVDGEREERFVPLVAEFVRRVDPVERVVELVPGALEEG